MNFHHNSARLTDSIYTSTARLDGTARALSNDELREIAPSIFARTAHESRSARFRPIPTIDVLDALRKEGFQPVGARQCLTRVPGKAAFTKHLIRLRRLDDLSRVLNVGDNIFEIMLKNANDGTGAYDLISGLWRTRCQNSLVALSELHDSLRVTHTGDVMGKVIDGTYRVLDNAELALEAPEKWANVKLEREEKAILAETAHELRFGDEQVPYAPAQLLAPRRFDDRADDLWTTFNVIQENAVRGGVSAREIVTDPETGRDRTVKRTTRTVKAIDNSLKLNAALWKMADKFAQLKGVTIAAPAKA